MIQLFKAKSLKKTREKEKSKGRSMVEMLGVLAIIGVLSIGGIQGYTMAMRKYRANEILNVANKYALLVYANCQMAMEKNPETYGIEENVWNCPVIDFSDAGLGAMPNGVLKIGNNMSAHGPVTIKTLSSGDAVVIRVQFETKELCEAVMNITGTPVSDSVTPGMASFACDDKHDDKNVLAISFIEN